MLRIAFNLLAKARSSGTILRSYWAHPGRCPGYKGTCPYKRCWWHAAPGSACQRRIISPSNQQNHRKNRGIFSRQISVLWPLVQTPLLVHIPSLMVMYFPETVTILLLGEISLRMALIGRTQVKIGKEYHLQNCAFPPTSLFSRDSLAKRHITFFLLVKSKFWIVTPSGLTLVIFIVGNYKIKLWWLNPAFLDQSWRKPRLWRPAGKSVSQALKLLRMMFKWPLF